MAETLKDGVLLGGGIRKSTQVPACLQCCLNTFIFNNISPACAQEYLTAATYYCLYLYIFILWGGTRSLCMPTLRPASQVGPMRNPKEGTSVVLRNTVRLT